MQVVIAERDTASMVLIEPQVSKKRLILNTLRMTVHNGPGIRTLVLFKGCPLRCKWCSTPESQEIGQQISFDPKKCTRCGHCVPACALQAISIIETTLNINRDICNNCGECAKVCYPEALKVIGKWVIVEELLHEVERDAVVYKHSGGGVTFSGGEPLLQLDFNIDMFKTLKERGISIGVDTCGHVPWGNIECLLPFVDFFLWDIKNMNAERHRQITGVSNELILENARLVSERGTPLYIRIPLIPGYNDSEENIKATSEFSRSLHSIVEIALLPVHHLGKARYEGMGRAYPIDNTIFVTDEVLHNIQRLVESYGLTCRIGA